MSAAARLDLVAHGATLSTRAARFPDDESLEQPALDAFNRSSRRPRVYQRVFAAPAAAALETAAALGFEAIVETALKDCDYGRWRGLKLGDVAASEPDGFGAWLEDPDAAPHGGESLAVLRERVSGFLDAMLSTDGAILAITHPAVVRAAIVSAIGCPLAAFWRIDVAPLSLARLSGRDGRWNLVALGPWSACQ